MDRVAIGVPYTETMYSQVCDNWLHINPQPVEWFPGHGSYLPEAHNRVVRSALEKKNWDRLLILENDMLVPSRLVSRVRQHRAPVVSGVYFSRRRPHKLMAFGAIDEDGTAHDLDHLAFGKAIDKGGEVPIAGAGTGILSIHRSVFEAMPFPWFEPSPAEIAKGTTGGHDIWFAHKVAELGLTFALDAHDDMLCYHIGLVPVGVVHYQAELQTLVGDRS